MRMSSLTGASDFDVTAGDTIQDEVLSRSDNYN